MFSLALLVTLFFSNGFSILSIKQSFFTRFCINSELKVFIINSQNLVRLIKKSKNAKAYVSFSAIQTFIRKSKNS